MHTLQGQNVLVLGLGASGLAMARWCARHGAHVTVADTRDKPPGLEALTRDFPTAQFVSAAMDASLLAGVAFDRILKSPGLLPTLVAPIIEANYQAKTGAIASFTGELELFSQALTDLKATQGYQPAVLAVTGTNGKTTVTALTGQLVARAGKTVAVAGNIGPTLLDTLSDCIDKAALPQVWVIELSSFQLDGVTDFEPTAATVLNVTQDHLDWHGTLQNYARAKANVFGQQALMLLNREDPLVMAMRPAPSAHGRTQGRVKDRIPQRDCILFGADMPLRPGDYGIEDVNGMAWLVRAQDADKTKRKRSRRAGPPQVAGAPSGGSAAHAVASVGAHEDDLHIQRLMPAEALRIRGRHNAVNALAALALACAAGCALAPMLFGLREYRGEPHRVESIAILNGVEFFDDSKGTNVGATVAALNGLGVERKIIVILGGDGKGQDFSPLAAPIARFARAVVLIGRDAAQIQVALQSTGVALLAADSMLQAVTLANQRAHAGDAVLMSPACASLDMFDNYKHRAAVFRDAVASLGHDVGVDVGAVA